MIEYSTVVKDKINLTPNTVELLVEVTGDFTFTPGQFVQFIIEDKVFRAYSIISLPKELPLVRFLIHLVPGGVGSEFVRTKNIGEAITFRGPVGNFIWNEKEKTTIFVATGVGLAPFISMIQDGLAKAGQCILLFGNREPETVFHKKLFENLEIEYDHFSFIPTLSGDASEWKGERGRVTKLLPELITQFSEAQFFLCGGAEMVRDTRALLLTSGVPMQNIKIEIFT